VFIAELRKSAFFGWLCFQNNFTVNGTAYFSVHPKRILTLLL